MATKEEQNKIEEDQYRKIDNLTKSVSELTGAVSVLNKTNTELTGLLKKALSYEFYVILILIAVLVYGAVGERGFNAIRNAVPIPVRADGDKTALAPWHNDLDRWMRRA